MRGYGQYCPVALGAEIFAERWTPIIIRNLMLGCHRFGEILDGAPGLPRSVLSQRLHHLGTAGVIVRTRTTGGGPSYELTPAGRELGDVCLALGAWAARWRETRPVDLDPYLALWMLARLIDPRALPRARVVVRFDLTDRAKPNRYWLVADRTDSEICAEFPGFDEDGIVVADADWLIRWHTGRVRLSTAIEDGGIQVNGPPWLLRLLTTWGALSPYASIAQAPVG
ncbi:MAG TPA: helix-turn-helix domain-containing protein [Microlunatus sp.]